MTIAIIGAGFTGLSAAFTLARQGVRVIVVDAANQVGGLAVGFREKNWDWSVERFYHHIFTNDTEIISLAHEIGIVPQFSRPTTAVLWKDQIFPFDSAVDLLRFPGLSMIDKIRMGSVLAGFKAIPNGLFLERWTAKKRLQTLMGKHGFQSIWEPLFHGKFHQYAADVNLAWFWARIKKRTARLGTFTGGFQAFTEAIAADIRKHGGEFRLNTKGDIQELLKEADAVLSTAAEPQGDTQYLDAHVALLELSRPFLSRVYWLNILDRAFPFLVMAEHTNFVSPLVFGGTHLLYIGNYCPSTDRLFSLSASDLLKEYFPWLRRINPSFTIQQVERVHVFRGPFAQPVVTVNYSRRIPPMRRGTRVFVANQAMIYPWDRGTNYAVELGKRAATLILSEYVR